MCGALFSRVVFSFFIFYFGFLSSDSNAELEIRTNNFVNVNIDK